MKSMDSVEGIPFEVTRDEMMDALLLYDDYECCDHTH